jgi:hypothetical protein
MLAMVLSPFQTSFSSQSLPNSQVLVEFSVISLQASLNLSSAETYTSVGFVLYGFEGIPINSITPYIICAETVILHTGHNPLMFVYYSC